MSKVRISLQAGSSMECNGGEQVSEYTPTTEDIRAGWEYATAVIGDEGTAQFDRWLLLHDREVVARTLAAQSTGGICKIYDHGLAWDDWLTDADKLIER